MTETAVARPVVGAGGDAATDNGWGRAGRRPTHGRGARSTLYAAGVYALASLGLWWHIWTGHPTSTTTCGCGDSSLFQWFLAWPAYAIAHGQNPWYSTALFHPHGVNLLANTGVVALGTVLAPVTWLWGPIVTFNLALTLAPLLSAFTMFLLVRRWVAWLPAAFCAGLLYGFSPFILLGLTDGHLMLSMAPMPPLILLCLDEIIVRQRRRPVAMGALLAIVLFVQFFVGAELLLIVGLCVALGMTFIVVYAALLRRRTLVQRWRGALVGLGAAAVVTAVALAYPTWFALAGPAHLSGPIWPPHSFISYGGANVHDYFLPRPPSVHAAAVARIIGGYQAPTLSGQYFGLGLIAVLLGGLIVWWRDLRLWLFFLVGAVSVPLSMGLSIEGKWTLWRLFVHLPLMENVIPSRFELVTYLCAAVMFGLILDHVRSSVGQWSQAPRGPAARWDVVSGQRMVGGTATTRQFAGTLVATAVALLALVPILAYDAPGLPFTTQQVVLPQWYRAVAPHLEGRQVLLSFPSPYAVLQSSLTWQAVDNMSYDQVGGSGPGAVTSRAGKERQAKLYLSMLTRHPAISPADVSVTRKALDGWGVTMIVATEPFGLPYYERFLAVRSAVVLMTAATGKAPVLQAGSWVWSRVEDSGPSVTLSPAGLAVCSHGPQQASNASIQRSAACVLSGSSAT